MAKDNLICAIRTYKARHLLTNKAICEIAEGARFWHVSKELNTTDTELFQRVCAHHLHIMSLIEAKESLPSLLAITNGRDNFFAPHELAATGRSLWAISIGEILYFMLVPLVMQLAIYVLFH